MRVGSVIEIKKQEFRVGLTPGNVREYVRCGHEVVVQAGLGNGSAFSDAEYADAGATVVQTAAEVWKESEMMVKVKEPLPEEYGLMRSGQILYTYLHLAADKKLAEAMMSTGVTGVAYETVTDSRGRLPLLTPMSEVAGRLSVIEGAKCLQKNMGGRGILLSGVPGTHRAKTLILGGGVVGMNACKIAVGMGARVVVMDVNAERLAWFDDTYGSQVDTVFSTETAIQQEIRDADLVIGAVLIPGKSAPKLIKRSYLADMLDGSVIVDVAVDQGGIAETSRPTYHDNPTFVMDGVVHYCVGNMPGSTPRTSTIALTNVTTGFGLRIAGDGLQAACKNDANLANGVNIHNGECTCENVAISLDLPYTPLAKTMAI